MKMSISNKLERPALAQLSLAMAHAGLLAVAIALPTAAAARTDPARHASVTEAPLLYIAQSTMDYGKYPGAKPPAEPAARGEASPSASEQGIGGGQGVAVTPSSNRGAPPRGGPSKPAPDSRDSSR